MKHWGLLRLSNLPEAKVMGNKRAKFQIQVFLVGGRKEAGPLSTSEGGQGQGCNEGLKRSFPQLCKEPIPLITVAASETSTVARPMTGVPTPRFPWWVGYSWDLGSLLEVAWAPESEGKCSRGNIFIQEACVDDRPLILHNAETTCNTLYDPLRIFLLQLQVTALER